MKKSQLTFGKDWKVIQGSRKSQAAVMVIKPGDSEGGPDNKHSGDQWLYVISGRGQAIGKGKKINLMASTLLFIKAGEAHQIKNTGRRNLETLNFYSPPQY